jgi:hypothetical protein
MALFTKKNPQTLKQLIKEAVTNEYEFRRLSGLDGDLSAEAYLAACAAVPGASVEEADKVEQALSGHEAELIRPSVTRMAKAIREFRRSGPILKLGGYCDDAGDAALARIGATRQSAFLAAARQVVKTHPEKFGQMTRANEFAEGIAKCMAQRARLLAEIEKSYGPGDLILDRDKASFRSTNGTVMLASGFAENLLNYHLSELSNGKAA